MEFRRAGHEIKMLSNLLKRQISSTFSEEEESIKHVTGVQARILGYLYHHREQEIFQRDIEAEFLIRRSTVTGILQLMEKNGLIYRQPVARDARLKQLMLTEKAKEEQQRIEKRIDRFEAKLTQGISEEEMETFYRVTEQMKRNLGG